jgi:hypothetical protein
LFQSQKANHPWTDFLSQGFGYVVCQPDDDDSSLQLVAQYMSGNVCGLMTSISKATLYSVAFGSQRTCGHEPHLHSYLGEIFAGDWAMSKCCHMLFGNRFVWVMDCYTPQFLFSYNCSNQAVQHLQMHIMGWDLESIRQTTT